MPIGFYVLTEQGARLSVKAKIDADFWQAKWKISDDQLSKRNGDLLLITLDRNRYRDQSTKDAETVRLLKRQVFWANVWKYTAVGICAALSVKVTMNQL